MHAPPRANTPQHWALLLLLASVAAMACFESSDGDLGFHLATGRAVLADGAIPKLNLLSFGEPQHPWLLHQWLPAVLFEWLWQHGGVTLLIACKMLLVTATWAVTFASARALGASPLAAAGACLLAAAASSFRFEIRPYLFTHLTLALTVWTLTAAVRAPTRSTRLQLFAAVSLFVGSQLHAGAIDSLIVLGLFALGTALEPGRARWLAVPAIAPHGMRSALGWLAATVLGLSVAAIALTLYHPWGARILAFPLEMAQHTYWSRHLVEFRHAWTLPASTLLAYWLWLAVVVLCACATRAATWHAGLCLIALAFAAASLAYARMVYAFALVSTPLVAATVSAWLARQRPAPARVQVLALLLLGCAGPAYVYRDHTAGFGLSPWVWPSSHFAFIREHALQGQAFVSDAWAGPFLGTFYPQRRVFFDDRLEAYSEHFARDVYQRMRYGEPGWDRLLDAYQIELVLLRYTTPGEAAFQHGAPNLRQLLAADARYTLVHFDDQGELFVRARGPNTAVAERYAMVGVDPDRRQFIGRPAQAAAGLLRAAGRGNRSSTLLALTALALADRGDSAHALAAAQAAQAQMPDDPWVGRVLAAVSGRRAPSR